MNKMFASKMSTLKFPFFFLFSLRWVNSATTAKTITEDFIRIHIEYRIFPWRWQSTYALVLIKAMRIYLYIVYLQTYPHLCVSAIAWCRLGCPCARLLWDTMAAKRFVNSIVSSMRNESVHTHTHTQSWCAESDDSNKNKIKMWGLILLKKNIY